MAFLAHEIDGQLVCLGFLHWGYQQLKKKLEDVQENSDEFRTLTEQKDVALKDRYFQQRCASGCMGWPWKWVQYNKKRVYSYSILFQNARVKLSRSTVTGVQESWGSKDSTPDRSTHINWDFLKACNTPFLCGDLQWLKEHISQMLVVFIFGCLIPASIRIIQKFHHQLFAAILAISALRVVLDLYTKTMTGGLEKATGVGEALLEWPVEDGCIKDYQRSIGFWAQIHHCGSAIRWHLRNSEGDFESDHFRFRSSEK